MNQNPFNTSNLNQQSHSNYSLERNHNDNYDVVIIGGGIIGAGIARECALRGLKVILCEQNDFSSGTSSASTKLAHGGLRYLEHFEFKLVFEALREREYLKHNASHLVKESEFIIPIYEDSNFKLWKLRIGLTLYDRLSSLFTKKPHKILSPDDVIERIPFIKKDGLVGGALYYDAVMDDARLTLETILQAEMFGAHVYNYVEVKDIYRSQNKITHLVVEDKQLKKQFIIKGKFYINTTGPNTDRFLKKFDQNHQSLLRPSKGVHLLLSKKITEVPILSETSDNRRFFILPWGDQTMIGTTDTDCLGDGNDLTITEDDKRYLLEETAYYFPENSFSSEDICSAFVGIRPLVKANNKSSSNLAKVSRKDKIINHCPNFISVIGGKYTTFRSISERVVRRYSSKFGIQFKSLTRLLPFYGGEIHDLLHYVEQHFDLEKEIFSVSKDVYIDILSRYGSMYHKVLSVICEKPEHRDLLPNTRCLKGEVIYSIRYEHTKKLEDFFRRRTTLYFQPSNGIQCLDVVASLFQNELNWTDTETQIARQEYLERVNYSIQNYKLFN